MSANNTLPISEARSKLPKLVDDAATLAHTTYITVKGRVKAAIIDVKELEAMEATLEVMSDPKLVEDIKEGLEDVKKGRLISYEQIKKELNLK